MRYIVDHDYHIHSQLSFCSSDPEQNNERILRYAEENGFKSICLTDHFWDESVEDAGPWEGFGHNVISKALPLPQSDKVKFLFGGETEMRKDFVIGLAPEHYDRYDFIVIPINHLHFTGFTISEEQAATKEGRAQVWIDKLEALLNADLPFEKVGIAHLACSLMGAKREDTPDILNLVPQEKLESLFSKAASVGAGIELNKDDIELAEKYPDAVLRIFKTAKKMGCKFYMGSDAHHPEALDKAPALFEKVVDLLQLTEDDKFHIGEKI